MRLFDKLHQTLPGVEPATPRTWSEHATTTLPSKISRVRSQILVQCSRTHFCDSSSNHRQTQLNDLGYKTITRVSIVVDVTIDMHASSSALPPLVACRSPRFFHRRGTATRRHSSPADAYSCNCTSLNSFTAKHTLEEHFHLRAIKATWSN